MAEFEPVWGDINIEYGGIWIKDQGDYADVAELTDLDGATGTNGMVMLEFGSVGLYGRDFAENMGRLRNAFQGGISLKGVNRKNARLIAWAELWNYGYGDHESPLIIRTDSTQPKKQDGWVAEITVKTGDLSGYLKSVHNLASEKDTIMMPEGLI